VTDVPGTTRDLLTERVDLGGVPVTLVDTAGLRHSDDVIEIEGVRRAREAQQVASLTLLVVDGSEPLADASLNDLEKSTPASIVVVSKADRPRVWQLDRAGERTLSVVEVSVLTGQGIEALRRRIVLELTTRDEWRDPPAVSNIRHLGLLVDALTVVERAEAALTSGATEELVLAELIDARRSLEEITGRRVPEDLLEHIFSRFCVGK
jgi:tRNA modification GTPase